MCPQEFATTDGAFDFIAIDAFDAWRSACAAGGLPIAVINAFAAFGSAVDFAALAARAADAQDAAEARKLLGWCRAKLGDMAEELAKVSAGAGAIATPVSARGDTPSTRNNNPTH